MSGTCLGQHHREKLTLPFERRVDKMTGASELSFAQFANGNSSKNLNLLLLLLLHAMLGRRSRVFLVKQQVILASVFPCSVVSYSLSAGNKDIIKDYYS